MKSIKLDVTQRVYHRIRCMARAFVTLNIERAIDYLFMHWHDFIALPWHVTADTCGPFY